MNYTLRLTENQQQELYSYLFVDENESAMLALCGFDSCEGETLLLVHKLIPVPYEICERQPNFMSWPADFAESALEEAKKEGLSIVKFHCHPSNYKKFSATDDSSDSELFDYFNAYFYDGRPVGSFVMVPDKSLFGRVIVPDGDFVTVNKISVIGSKHEYYFDELATKVAPEFTIRNQQTFGKGTTQLLQRLKIGIVGCSGLGTPTILELARSGIGELILIDREKIEVENLNRIFGASHKDIGKYKVDFFKEKLSEYGLDIKVTAIKADITEDMQGLETLSYCDHIFTATDEYLARDVINRLATYYIIGYTDLSIGLSADGQGGIDSIVGWVRYMVPGGSSLFTRGMYDSQDLERESLMKENPTEFKKKMDQKYIKGAKEKSPPVISLNATVSSLGVTDFLNRIHPFKYKSELGFCIDFCENTIDSEAEYQICSALKSYVGKGRVSPFLNLFGLSKSAA
ncbi:ThiF family adenylyltransferase [Ekhidna sp.]|uniref:ThiF family adenylyltransferase n=1 Tax=Ekhidna sp. TaxID=2608089 RepID=UPI003298DA60